MTAFYGGDDVRGKRFLGECGLRLGTVRGKVDGSTGAFHISGVAEISREMLSRGETLGGVLDTFL
jgi:hypothetical protein